MIPLVNETRSSTKIFQLSFRPSDLEADDEDTQDGDSLNHLKLDINLTELNIKEDSQLSTSHDSTPESPPIDLAEVKEQKRLNMNAV